MTRVRQFLIGLSALLLVPSIAWCGQFSGTLWIVSSSGLAATFPVPSATPDATFTTAHLSFFMNAPSPNDIPYAPNLKNSVKGFLDSADGVADLTFSGLTNSVLDAVVGPATPVVNSSSSSYGTYGVYIELTGQVNLIKDEYITVTHDDGVSLMIDGSLVSGLTSSNTPAIAEVVQFTGTTGLHTIDLVYVNSVGLGLLSFSPQM